MKREFCDGGALLITRQLPAFKDDSHSTSLGIKNVTLEAAIAAAGKMHGGATDYWD